jgi:hypothetical protein
MSVVFPKSPKVRSHSARLNRGHALAGGLQGYWPLHEGTGRQVANLVGAPYSQGTANTGTLSWRNAVDGPALDLTVVDATNPAIDLGVFNQATNGYLAASLWVKLDSTRSGSTGSLLGAYDGSGTTSSWMVWHVAGETGLRAYAAGFGNGNVTGATNVFDDKWHHIVAIWNNVGSGGLISLYVDGKLDAGPTGISNCQQTTTHAQLGAMVSGSAISPQPGLIANVALWSGRPFGLAEVQELYRNPLTLLAPSRRQFVAVAAGGGTTFTQAVSASLGQSSSLSKSVYLGRSASQAQLATMARQALLVRPASEQASASIPRAIASTKSTTQAQSASAIKQVKITRTTTSSLLATVQALKVILFTVAATVGQSATIKRATALVRSASAGGSVAIQKSIAAVRPTTTALTASTVKGLAKTVTASALSAFAQLVAQIVGSTGFRPRVVHLIASRSNEPALSSSYRQTFTASYQD